jgi:DNA primase
MQPMTTVQAKQVFIKQVMPQIEAIKNNIKRQLYIKRLSELTGIDEEHFAPRRIYEAGNGTQKADTAKAVIEKKVINACIARPELLHHFHGKEVLNYIKNEDIREIMTRMVTCFEQDNTINVRDFVEVFDKEDLRNLVLSAAFDPIPGSAEEPEKVLLDYMRHIERQFFREKSKKITEKLAEAESKGDVAAIAELLKQKAQVLTHIKNNFL